MVQWFASWQNRGKSVQGFTAAGWTISDGIVRLPRIQFFEWAPQIVARRRAADRISNPKKLVSGKSQKHKKHGENRVLPA